MFFQIVLEFRDSLTENSMFYETITVKIDQIPKYLTKFCKSLKNCPNCFLYSSQ